MKMKCVKFEFIEDSRFPDWMKRGEFDRKIKASIHKDGRLTLKTGNERALSFENGATTQTRTTYIIRGAVKCDEIYQLVNDVKPQRYTNL